MPVSANDMETDRCLGAKLSSLKEELDRKEEGRLSALATLSRAGRRRRPEKTVGHRQSFALDADRILHSRAYTRYIDKTQVFSLVSNDHITHRVLHVQLVSKIARTIGRLLGLNEDLIEAIALGHDLGHPPFGHNGEKELSGLCVEHGLPAFQHNMQSVRFLEQIEKGGSGLNLCLQTLDGILCHDGEIHNRSLRPVRARRFEDFDCDLARKTVDPGVELLPMTLEGCVVRFSDTISYIGRDIEDAIELKLISRREIPESCRQELGDTNGTIVYRLVEDLITNSMTRQNSGKEDDDSISFSPAVSASLQTLKKFNYQRIYMNPLIKKDFHKISKCYRALFETYLDHLRSKERGSAIYREFIDRMDPSFQESNQPAVIVRDFIAGMTDDYFLSQSALLGCDVPVKSHGVLTAQP